MFSDYNNISKFLNRILGMQVELQNNLFKYFTETLTAIILEAKRNGRWDMGILGKLIYNYIIVIFIVEYLLFLKQYSNVAWDKKLMFDVRWIIDGIDTNI